MSERGREVIGSVFRGLLTGGSWMRLAIWAKMGAGRKLALTLEYPDGLANFALTLTENGSTVFEESGASWEAVTMSAVSALGKTR